MAVLVVMEQKGDTQELLKKYDIVSQHMMQSGMPPAELIGHFCIETPDGIRVSNVWETEAAATAGMNDPRLIEGFKKAGMPESTPQMMKIHNHFITSEMKAGV